MASSCISVYTKQTNLLWTALWVVAAGTDSGSDAMFASANQAVSDAFASIRVVQAYNLQKHVRYFATRLTFALY